MAHSAMASWRQVKTLGGVPEYAYAQKEKLIQYASKTHN